MPPTIRIFRTSKCFDKTRRHQKNVILNPSKKQRCFGGDISVESDKIIFLQRWDVALKHLGISTVKSWIRAARRVSGNEQRGIKTETTLTIADTFWIRANKRWLSLRYQPGEVKYLSSVVCKLKNWRVQNCPRIACQKGCFCRQKYMQFAEKTLAIASKTPVTAGKNSCNSKQ